jgi:Mrp family chromosome partitioning ATPase
VKHYFASIKQYSWIVLVCFVLSLIGGIYLSKSQTPVYSVNSIFIVTQRYSVSSNSSSTSVTDLIDAATNYSAEIPTRAVMEYVVQHYPEIGKRGYSADDLLADVVPAPSTTVPTVTLTAAATGPNDTVLLANSVADGFASYIQSQLQAQLDAQRKDLQNQYTFYKNDSDNLAKQILGYPTTDPHISILTSERSNDLSEMSDLSKQIASLPTTAPSNIQVIQHAKLSDVSVTTKRSLILAATAGIGLILGTLAMLLVIFLDKRLRSEEQIKEKLGLAYLGGISTNNDLKSSSARLSSSVAHELADISANLRLTGVLTGQWQAPNGAVLLVTSPQAAEGKTTLAVGLAAIAARGGQTVVVVDGNLDRPSTHLAYGMSPAGPGLNGLLKGTGRETVDNAVMRSKVPGVWLLPVTTPMEASAILLEQKMPALLSQLRKKIDLVIIDGPSLLSGAVACVLATMADGVALVIDARQEKLPVLKRAKVILSTLTKTPAGIVINRRSRRSNKNPYFATALPTRSAPEEWERVPVTVFEGNGYSSEMSNGRRIESMPAVVAAPPTMVTLPVKVSTPLQGLPFSVPSMPPSSQPLSLPPSPAQLTYQQMGTPTRPTIPLSPSPHLAPRPDITPPPLQTGKDE